MADIFISYSKTDLSLVTKLAAMLEAGGWTVWFDKNLSVGDLYRDEIMRQLTTARAVICVWTETSVKSDWVRAEAGRAKADSKLIPVKVSTLGYHEIPLPFGEMHTEELGKDEQITTAIAAQLAKPHLQQTQWSLTWKTTRYELLSWLGIFGAAITCLANLEGIIRFARLAKAFFSGWADLVHMFWSTALALFALQIDRGSALAITSALFIAGQVVASSRRLDDFPKFLLRHSLPIWISLSIISTTFLVPIFFADALFFQINLNPQQGGLDVSWEKSNYFVLVLALSSSLCLVWGAMYFSRKTTGWLLGWLGFLVSWRLFSERLTLVVFLIALIASLNYAYCWLELQPWYPNLLK